MLADGRSKKKSALAQFISGDRQKTRICLWNKGLSLMSEQMDISKELRDLGLKVTLPRLRILQLFHERPVKHLSAEEIYRLLLNEEINVGFSTIYRVLMQFAEAGILSRHHFESGTAVFELKEESHHDHLICTVCSRVEEFLDKEIERRQEEIAKALGFVLQEHSLSLYGICSTCMK